MVTEKRRYGDEPVRNVDRLVSTSFSLEEPVPGVDRSQTVLDPRWDPENFTLENFLPPVDVAMKIYSIDAVNVLQNTFTGVFGVLLDWEDPSL